jgi:hypothetical protein
VSFAAITLCVASQRVFVVVDFVIDSVRKLLDTPTYLHLLQFECFNSSMEKKRSETLHESVSNCDPVTATHSVNVCIYVKLYTEDCH